MPSVFLPMVQRLGSPCWKNEREETAARGHPNEKREPKLSGMRCNATYQQRPVSRPPMLKCQLDCPILLCLLLLERTAGDAARLLFIFLLHFLFYDDVLLI